jgi:hypothetical protein
MGDMSLLELALVAFGLWSAFVLGREKGAGEMRAAWRLDRPEARRGTGAGRP